MKKWVIFLVVFTGFICFSSACLETPDSDIKLCFDEGTTHFKKKHYSGPPEEDGTHEGAIATQILGPITKVEFVGGKNRAKTERGNRETVEIKFTAKVQNWTWGKNGPWKKQGNPQPMSKINIRGTWKDDGDFVDMTWDTGY